MKLAKFLKFSLLLFVFNSCCNNSSEIPPSKDLTNGIIKAKIYLPDKDIGYYRATRFDWSGIIYSLEYDNYSYIGQWFENYDPLVHESVTGPVQEFGVIGFDTAQVGEGFLKIGVGILKKSNEKSYHFSNQYKIINSGEWKVNSGDRKIEFVHHLESEIGYSYIYAKTIELTKNKPEIVIKHRLKNTGSKIINTEVYNHNFFIIDKELAGPNITLEFNFNIEGVGRGLGKLFEIQGNKIVYLKDLPIVNGKKTTGAISITGYNLTAENYNFKIENQRTQTGIRVRGDQPISRFRFWTSTTTYCPEPYIKVHVEPNYEITWEYIYEIFHY